MQAPPSPAPLTQDSPLPDDLAARVNAGLRGWARECGFADAAVAEQTLQADQALLQRWLEQGRHGGMAFMARDPAMRADPTLLRPGTLSVISARLDYRPAAEDAESVLADGDKAYISRYALGRDYHKLIRNRLKRLAERIAREIGPYGYRVLTDSAPALEKALARNAGLGWIGKNTLLLNREAGSWFFLGEIYTNLPLTGAAPPVPNLCGSCSACIDICPTQAIVAPYQLDARRCISYLTIEHHGAIPKELRPLLGNRIFGCDDCQLVCPWNRYARIGAEPEFAPRHSLDSVRLAELFGWSEEHWSRMTEGMALRRTGYSRFLRNVAVALGNAPPGEEARTALLAREHDADELVREHVRWALERQHRDAGIGIRDS